MNEDPIIVRTLLEALLGLAEHTLRLADTKPGTCCLCEVSLTDPDIDSAPDEAVAVALRVDPVLEFGGEPWRNLVGVHASATCHGLLLLRSAAGEKVVELVMRDGTEFRVRHVERVGSAGADTAGGVEMLAPTPSGVVLRHTVDGVVREVCTIGDSVGWALRRVLGLPSNAPVDRFATCAEVRDRVMYSMVADAAACAVDIDHVQTMIQFLHKERDMLYVSACVAYGLFQDCWDDAVDMARRMADQVEDEDVAALSAWMDGPMWASYCGERFERVEDALARIEQLVCEGRIDAATGAAYIQVAGAEPNDDDPF